MVRLRVAGLFLLVIILMAEFMGNSLNVLLQKSILGKAKPSTRKLPASNFVYGRPEMMPDRETASEGISFLHSSDDAVEVASIIILISFETAKEFYQAQQNVSPEQSYHMRRSVEI